MKRSLNEPDIAELRSRLRVAFGGDAPIGGYPGDPFCQECFEGKVWWEIEPEAFCHYDSCQMYGTDAQRAYYFIGLIDVFLRFAAGALDANVAMSASQPLVWNYQARETGGLYMKTLRQIYDNGEIALILECVEAVGCKTEVCEFVEIEEWDFFIGMLRQMLV